MKTSKTEKVVFPLDIRTKTEKHYSEEKRRISVWCVSSISAKDIKAG